LRLENKLCNLGHLNNFVCYPSSSNYIKQESKRKSHEGVIESEDVDGDDEEEWDGEKEISENDPNK